MARFRLCITIASVFSLALDYGVSSICFGNRSSIDVAQIEGALSYQEMMRSEEWYMPLERCGHIHGPIYDSQSSIRVQSWRDYLPPWLGGRRPDARIEVLSKMMQALKTATEANVGSRVTHVTVTFPLEPSAAMSLAVSKAATHVWMEGTVEYSAGPWAAQANNVGNHTCIADKRVVLTVDYSRAAMTASLFVTFCNNYEQIRSVHRTRLGASHWSPDCRQEMVSVLRRLTRMPVEIHPGGFLDHISAVILLGENGRDGRMRSVLIKVLEGTGSHLQAGLDMDDGMADPRFAAAIGAAEWSLSSRVCAPKDAPGAKIFDTDEYL